MKIPKTRVTSIETFILLLKLGSDSDYSHDLYSNSIVRPEVECSGEMMKLVTVSPASIELESPKVMASEKREQGERMPC